MNTKDSKLKNNIIIRIFLKLTPSIYFFFICAFLGWICETIYCFIPSGVLTKRGFLYGPICPIYGYGALILMLYFYKSESKQHNYFKLFFMFILIFSLFEYFVGFALEAVFADRWWDYSGKKYNINGRITILNSFFWGVATIVFAKFIYPLTKLAKEKVISKMPDVAKLSIDFILLTAISIDFIFSCIRYLK